MGKLGFSIILFIKYALVMVCIYAFVFAVIQFAAATEWQMQTVDGDGRVGYYPSIALDGNGYPHISYYNYDNRNLKYSYWDGEAWQIQTVDGGWGLGSHNSLALDGNDYPHISYLDYTNHRLKYSYWDGEAWQIQVVDSGESGGSGNFGAYNSLALDGNGYPHISYYENNGNLKYSYWDGETWQIQTVDSDGHVGEHTSLALDSNDYPHISYHAGSNEDLKYSYWDGETWQIQIVDSGEYAGYYTSLALDSNDHPHISYHNEFYGDPGDIFPTPNHRLKYSYWDGEAWQVQTVDNGVNTDTSLALDSNDHPHISYHDWTNGELKYSYWDGGLWQIQTVDSGGGRVGEYNSLALDGNGYPHIGYYDDPNGAPMQLKYAVADVATGQTPDVTPPAAATNLAASNPTSSSITLTWTAPGDDGSTGTANQYDIRYSTSPITDANWDSATQATGEPSPQAAGTSESLTVTGLSSGTTYHFAMKTADEVPNWSGLSNVATGETLLTDVTAMSQVDKFGTRFDRRTDQYSMMATWTNIGIDPFSEPLHLVIESITPNTVTCANADGTTTDGKPYYDYSNLVGDGKLVPGETSAAKRLAFNNSERIRFDIVLSCWASVEGGGGAPRIKSIGQRKRIHIVIPVVSALAQNFPNPFNPETWIPYELAESSDVKISIYDIQGRLVKTIHLGHREIGQYFSKEESAYWDGRNGFGERTGSGTYFYQIKAGDFQAVRKMVILK